ncbi:MAG: alpha/beta hydrolase [Hyphomonadaceae bacterium]
MKDRSFSLSGKNGHGVLLIHGLTGAPGEMKYLARKLNRAGFAINCPQLAGHGADLKTLLTTTWADWLDSLHQGVEALRKENDTISVAGICVGGALGLLLTEHHPDIAAAAVYSMTFYYDGWNMKRWYVASAHLLWHVADLPLLRSLSFSEPYPFGLKDEKLREAAAKPGANLIPGALDRLPMGSMYQMHRLGAHLERMGPRLSTPTLILHAQEDDMSDPRNAFRLRDALGGPTHVRLLKDSYHMIHVDKERDLVADLTGDFFANPRRFTDVPLTGELRHA